MTPIAASAWLLERQRQRHRRAVYAFALVVGHDQGHVGPLAADPGDDRGQHLRQFRSDHQKPLGVGLGVGDLQQPDQLSGGRQPVLDEAVVRQFGQFFNANPFSMGPPSVA